MTNWFYTDTFGTRLGPISDQQLHELVAQGTITPNTSMETDAGQKGVAGQIPGLFAVAPPPFAQAAPPVAQVFCTNCGNPVAEQAVACMACGATPIGHRRFCRYCAAALNPAQVVCTHCGSAIRTNDTSRSVGGDTAWASEKPPFDPTFLLISSVVITFCCCLPAGITGIIFTNMCKQDLQEGRYEGVAGIYWTANGFQ